MGNITLPDYSIAMNQTREQLFACLLGTISLFARHIFIFEGEVLRKSIYQLRYGADCICAVWISYYTLYIFFLHTDLCESTLDMMLLIHIIRFEGYINHFLSAVCEFIKLCSTTYGLAILFCTAL